MSGARGWAVLASLTWTMGCVGGTETGNPPATASMSLVAVSSDESIAAIGESRGGVGLASVWMSLGPLTVVGCGAGAVEHEVVEARVIELLHGAPSDIIEPGETPVCRLDAGWERPVGALPAAAPAVLAAATLVLEGTRADGVRFTFVIDRTRAAPLKNDEQPIPLPMDGQGWLLAYDVAAWFDGLDMSLVTVEPDGTILVGRDTNTALRVELEDRLAAAVTLHTDHDADGILDPEDVAPIGQAP